MWVCHSVANLLGCETELVYDWLPMFQRNAVHWPSQSRSLGLLVSWRWRHCGPLVCQEPPTHDTVLYSRRCESPWLQQFVQKVRNGTDIMIVWLQGGHAIGHAHQSLLTTEVCVQTQGSPHGFLLNKFILGQVFLWDPVGFISPILHAFPSSEAGATGHRTKELKSHCYIHIKLCRNSIYSAESGDSLPDKKKAHQFWV